MKKIQKISIILIIIVLIYIVCLLLISNTDVSNNIHNENLPIKTIIETNTNIGIDDIPVYSGQIVITINNDIPYFEDKDITTENFEKYSELDELKRARVAFANICSYTMPPDGTKRGNISYKPSGWIQYLYGENKSKHLYERCHLIAWQLGNENNNEKNLITGTSQMNQAMIKYENEVANWIKQKNNQGLDYHVIYRVTPIYEGNNSLATGVEMEAKSVEEEGVMFNKFIYNVEDNFNIDYITGNAKLIGEEN